MKILIVDDEKEIADYIYQLVEDITFHTAETEVFYSGTAALNRIKEEKFALIISDVVMPITDGFALLEYIVKNEIDSQFIFLSVYKEFDYIYRANKLRKIDYIVKSETPDVIKKIISKNLDLIKENKKNAPSENGIVKSGKEDEAALVSRVCSFIEENLVGNLNVNSVAEAIHYNPTYLSRLFKEYMGIKMYQYILEQKLKKAKEYLIETDYSIAKISCMLGYQSVQGFGRVFRKTEHITPQEYRRNYK